MLAGAGAGEEQQGEGSREGEAWGEGNRLEATCPGNKEALAKGAWVAWGSKETWEED